MLYQVLGHVLEDLFLYFWCEGKEKAVGTLEVKENTVEINACLDFLYA